MYWPGTGEAARRSGAGSLLGAPAVTDEPGAGAADAAEVRGTAAVTRAATAAVRARSPVRGGMAASQPNQDQPGHDFP
jgi:hypothetical protein